MSNSKILVVEDDAGLREALVDTLLLAGFQCVEADSGESALLLLKHTTVDLVVSDVQMPGMSGYEVCEQVRAAYDHGQLPIILLTALSQAEDRIRGFNVGANDYLTKPFNKPELAARIRAHLSASKAEQRRIENKQLLLELQQCHQVQTLVILLSTARLRAV